MDGPRRETRTTNPTWLHPSARKRKCHRRRNHTGSSSSRNVRSSVSFLCLTSHYPSCLGTRQLLFQFSAVRTPPSSVFSSSLSVNQSCLQKPHSEGILSFFWPKATSPTQTNRRGKVFYPLQQYSHLQQVVLSSRATPTPLKSERCDLVSPPPVITQHGGLWGLQELRKPERPEGEKLLIIFSLVFVTEQKTSWARIVFKYSFISETSVCLFFCSGQKIKDLPGLMI